MTLKNDASPNFRDCAASPSLFIRHKMDETFKKGGIEMKNSKLKSLLLVGAALAWAGVPVVLAVPAAAQVEDEADDPSVEPDIDDMDVPDVDEDADVSDNETASEDEGWGDETEVTGEDPAATTVESPEGGAAPIELTEDDGGSRHDDGPPQ